MTKTFVWIPTQCDYWCGAPVMNLWITIVLCHMEQILVLESYYRCYRPGVFERKSCCIYFVDQGISRQFSILELKQNIQSNITNVAFQTGRCHYFINSSILKLDYIYTFKNCTDIHVSGNLLSGDHFMSHEVFIWISENPSVIPQLQNKHTATFLDPLQIPSGKLNHSFIEDFYI